VLGRVHQQVIAVARQCRAYDWGMYAGGGVRGQAPPTLIVVITGCGHAGVVNIARYARRLTGDQPLYARFPDAFVPNSVGATFRLPGHAS
jgi:hypothetical protein